MIKLWGLLFLVSADVLLVRYFTECKKKPVQCLREMIGFTGGVTYGMTEWKRTLEKAITQEKKQGKFPKLFQEKFLVCRKTVSLREAIVYALGELPLPKEATELLSCYFAELGKSTKKNTEEMFEQTRLRLEELLLNMRAELPKKQKIIAAGVYSVSAMIAILLW